MRSRSILRVLAALTALTFFVAACGGSDDSDSESSTTDSGTDDSSTDDAGDGEGGDALPTDDGDDAATSGLNDDEAGDEATSDVIGSAGSDDFCSLYVQNQDLVNEFDFFDPVQVQQWIETSSGLLDQAIGTAPSDIAADLQTIRDDFAIIAAELEANEYDFLAAAEVLEDIDTPEADAASERIDAYVESVCGVDPDQAADDFAESVIGDNLDSLLENDAFLAAIVEGMTEGGEITEEQATCFLSNVDTDLLAGFAGDGGADSLSDPAVLQDLLGVFETCGIALG